MRYFLRHLPLLTLAACVGVPAGGRPQMLAAGDVGCERAEYGPQARVVAIYSRVVSDRVCVLDSAGQCHPRVDGGTVSAEVRLPQTRNAPPADALRQELGRRGILARIARPRGPKMYASLGADRRENALLILELSEIGISDDGNVAHVMVRASRAVEGGHQPAPGGELVRLVRTLEVAAGGFPRHATSPVRACWHLERSASRALAD